MSLMPDFREYSWILLYAFLFHLLSYVLQVAAQEKLQPESRVSSVNSRFFIAIEPNCEKEFLKHKSLY